MYGNRSPAPRVQAKLSHYEVADGRPRSNLASPVRFRCPIVKVPFLAKTRLYSYLEPERRSLWNWFGDLWYLGPTGSLGVPR